VAVRDGAPLRGCSFMGSSSPARQLRSFVRLLLGAWSSVGHAGPNQGRAYRRGGTTGRECSDDVGVTVGPGAWVLRLLELECAAHPKMKRERISRQGPMRLATD
jgi:hypothetical protein